MKTRGARPMMRGIVTVAILALAWIVGAAAGGYRSAEASSSIMGQQAEDANLTAGHHADESTARINWDATRWSATKARLLADWQLSPGGAASPDWELQMETQRLLAEMPTDALAAFLRELPTDSRIAPRSFWLLRRAVMFEWAARDAPGLLQTLESLPSHPLASEDLSVSFMAWAGEHQEDALAWLRGDLPPGLDKRRKDLGFHLFTELAKSDFSRMERELVDLDSSERATILQSLGSNGRNPEMREQLLRLADTAGLPDGGEGLKRSILAGWMGKDPEGALAKLAQLEIPEDQRNRLEVAMVLERAGLNPADAIQGWMARHGDQAEVPLEVISSVGNWIQNDPDGARKWLDTLPADHRRDAFYGQGVRDTSARARYPVAAEMATAIQDEKIRTLALRTLRYSWQKSDREAAAAWQQSLSAEDRAALGE